MNKIVALVVLTVWSLVATPRPVINKNQSTIAKMDPTRRVVQQAFKKVAEPTPERGLLVQLSFAEPPAACVLRACGNASERRDWSASSQALAISFDDPDPFTVTLIGFGAACFIVSHRLG